MIPPDYTALERKARFYASRRRASGGYTLAEFLEESADALALAASLQDEKDGLRSAIREWSDASAEADRLALGWTDRVQKAEQVLRECGLAAEKEGE